MVRKCFYRKRGQLLPLFFVFSFLISGSNSYGQSPFVLSVDAGVGVAQSLSSKKFSITRNLPGFSTGVGLNTQFQFSKQSYIGIGYELSMSKIIQRSQYHGMIWFEDDEYNPSYGLIKNNHQLTLMNIRTPVLFGTRKKKMCIEFGPYFEILFHSKYKTKSRSSFNQFQSGSEHMKERMWDIGANLNWYYIVTPKFEFGFSGYASLVPKTQYKNDPFFFSVWQKYWTTSIICEFRYYPEW